MTWFTLLQRKFEEISSSSEKHKLRKKLAETEYYITLTRDDEEIIKYIETFMDRV